MHPSPYYRTTGKIALISTISLHVRERMFATFMARMKPDAHHRVLDIGVTGDERFRESNFFERLYPHKHKLVCVGTENGSYLETAYPGVRFIQITPHEPLPFSDNEFDIAFSNAVIEHVGSRNEQMAFVREMARVSRSFFLTTPNRWFPIELHTALPLLHFLPPGLYRKTLTLLGETYWNREENLNLLTSSELRALFSDSMEISIERVPLFGFTSNLIACQNSGAAR